MNIHLVSTGSTFSARRQPRRSRGFSILGAVTALGLLATTLPAQDAAPNADEQRGRRRDATGKENGERRAQSPEDMQARLMTQMRERFEVTDDEEWTLISGRIAKVMELRRAAGGGAPGVFGAFGGRGAPPGGTNAPDARGGRAGRGGPAGNTEVAALSAALRDKLPDAEVKARLDRVRDTRKENEAKLVKAQEELRAVLSVRQEAQAVVFGMLP